MILATCAEPSALANVAVFLVALIISILLALAVFAMTDKATGRDLPPIK